MDNKTVKANHSWYVLSVPPAGEFRVADALKRRGLAFLVPYEKKWSRRKIRRFPVFPRYVFMGCAETPAWMELASIEPAPVKPLSIDGKPAKLSPTEVAHLASIKGSDLPANFNLGKALKEGMPVIITDGPFSGMETRIDKIDSKHGDASVQVQLFGANNSVTIPLASLEAT